MSHPGIGLFFKNNIRPEFTELLDTRQITIQEFHWTDRELTEYNVFVELLRIYTEMSLINFKFIFSSG